MNQSGPGKDPSSIFSTPTSKGRPGIIPSSSSCRSSNNPHSISNKVPTNSDISNTQNNLFDEEPEVIELSNKDTIISADYNNCAKTSNKSESRFSMLASSSSSLNNNQMSNDFSETKVPNTINNINNTSKTKVPIDSLDASTSSILSTTLLSASTKTSSSSTVNVPINKNVNSNNNSSSVLKNNNKSMFNNVTCNNNNSNSSENENMQSAPNRMINSFDIPLSTKSSSDSANNFDDVLMLNSMPTSSNEGSNYSGKPLGKECGVEKFVGKIVYNKKGSAYIIDDQQGGLDSRRKADGTKNSEDINNDEDFSEDQAGSILKPLEESAMLRPLLSPLKDQFKDTNNDEISEERVQDRGDEMDKNMPSPSFYPPKISNAFYVTRSAAYYNTLYGQAYAKMLRERMVLPTPDSPVVHSYKVYSMREENNQEKTGYDDCSKNLPLLDASSVPVKPILMCFLCKLSFGYSSSFLSHCLTEHSIDLTNDEKSALERNQNCSAIIQAAGKDKTPLLSFLDPVVKESRDIPIRPNRTLSPNSIKGLLSAALTQQGTESNHSSLKGNALNSLLLPPPASSPHRSGSLSPSKMTAPPSLFPSLPSPFGNNLALSSNMSGALPSPSDDGSDGDIDRKQTNSQLSIPFHSSQGNAAIDAITGVPSLSVTSAANLFAENSNIQSSMLRNSLDLAMSRKDGSPTSLNNNFVGDGQRSPGLPPLTPLPGRSSSQSPMPQGFLGSAMGQLGNPANFPSNANMLQGNTIGACPEHMNGRQAGVDCSKCDIILNSSRMPGGIGWNAARNTCKTLKCPKCNWHYKYQETLEIHMKEKHPDSETNCIYCVTGQQHPRLARGETYTCGYKPYRCEVCNYSTTTKGNLSIHMQSDKHLNNMQELQNGVAVATQPDGSKLPQSPLGPLPRPPVMGPCMSPINLAALQKAKPSWRCDVCNYETNVARNLRIHMTSEKHTHNIMVLQQNVKHIQNMSQGNGNGGIGISQGSPSNIPTSGLLPPLFGLDPQQILQMQLGLGNVPGIPGPPSSQGGVSEKGGQSEAAMADLAYIQAVMMQMMTGGQFPPGPHPPEFGVNPLNNSGLPSPGLMAADSGISPDSLEPPPEPANENPKFLFNCCVCREFGCDAMEIMSQHLTADRTRGREHEVSIVIGGNFICKLCSYKTNLKANFQLHCKTDKHLQRLNHVNHIKEGGPGNEWRLKFLNVTNPVQLRCNACDYYTNSLHKLQLHAANQRHEISTILFSHLKKCEEVTLVSMETAATDGTRSPFLHSRSRSLSYRCCLCKYSGPGKLPLMAHVRSMKHLQMEQIHQLQKRSEGNNDHTEIGDIFQVVEVEENDEGNSEDRKNVVLDGNDISNKHGEHSTDTGKKRSIVKDSEEETLECIDVREEGMNEGNTEQTATISGQHDDEVGIYHSDDGEMKSRNEVQKTLNKKESKDTGMNKERKDGCLSSSHSPTPSMHCPLCQEQFEEYEILETHVMLIHSVNSDGLKRLLLLMEGSHWLNNSQSKGRDYPRDKIENDENPMDGDETKENEGPPGSCSKGNEDCTMDTTSGELAEPQDELNQEIHISANESFKDKLDNTFKRTSITPGSLFGIGGNRTKLDKMGLNYPLEKYLDPNRPYKCDVCKESFTQKNILLVHYNSVSHLHKLKKTMQDQQQKKDLALKSFGNRALSTQHMQQQSHSLQNHEKSVQPKSNSLETALSNMANKINLLGNDDEAKPYKCNICNVAYSQGSTLDIHIRSVLHQGRASKLQELAITGQYDLSKPPFEQPESQTFDENQKKLLQGMLSPNSLNSTGSSVPQASPTSITPGIPPTTPPNVSPISSPLLNLKHALLSSKVNQWSPDGLAGTQSSRSQQQLLQLLQTLPHMPGSVRPSDAVNKSHVPYGNDVNIQPKMSMLDDDSSSPQRPPSVLPMLPSMLMEGGGKKSPQVVKNLLENYGFELVMQFNEYHQRKKLRDEEERRKKESEDQTKNAAETGNDTGHSKVSDGTIVNVEDSGAEGQKEETSKYVEQTKKFEKDQLSVSKNTSFPEIKKSKCLLCNKVFSSIWVLKAHSEEIHKDIVPQDFLEKYVEELKSNITANNSSGTGSDIDDETTKLPTNYLTPEKSSEEETQQTTPIQMSSSNAVEPKTSTPKNESLEEHIRLKMTPSPASNIVDCVPSPNDSNSRAKFISEEISSPSEPSTSKSNLTDMQNAFQMAILSAQQQSQGINPMMLQMAQLQGIPPLVAMNLQPPLIPPSMLTSPSGGRSSTSPRDNMVPSPSSLPPLPMDPPMQLLSKLGIDPKMIAQTGLDPQVLMQLGQMDPKQILQGGLDPKILAMFATKQQSSGGKHDNTLDQNKHSSLFPGSMDPTSLFNQMMKMGIPPPQMPDQKLLFQLAQMGSSDSSSMTDQISFPSLSKFDGHTPGPPGTNSIMSQPSNHPLVDNNALMGQKSLFQQPPEQIKRARTRITDDQLKVLRSNFDINNSPTEAATNTMAQQTGLPPKVIKHWFRNTLFKERQRNKDSPYNFNNPPSTMLNLEEYEKTGESKYIDMKPEEQNEFGPSSTEGKPTTDDDSPHPGQKEQEIVVQQTSSVSTPSSTPEIRVRNDEELKERESDAMTKEISPLEKAFLHNSISSRRGPPNLIPLSGEHTPPTSNTLSLNPLLSTSSPGVGFLPHTLVPNFYPPVTSPGLIPPPGRLPELFNPLANMMSNEQSYREQTPPPMSGSQLGQGKRANRTRFTDYQIKVLQEFFENNAYPKDDDLEYLSKLLSLSPRVIVVWFQNARQKARKIYENQPPLDPHDEGAGRFTRTPGLNYQCKKCLLVFQRYYELIRHQKQHCFKEEDAKRSAQAQKAAAQAAAQFGGPQGCGASVTAQSEDSNSSTGHDRSLSSPMLNQTGTGFGAIQSEGRRSFEAQEDWPGEPNFPIFGRRDETEKKMTPSMFDQLTRVGGCNGPDVEQFPKMQTPGSILFPNYPPSTPFGILQHQAMQSAVVGLPKAGDSSRDDSADDFDNESVGSSPSSKRKLSDDGGDTDAEKDESGQPRDKRLRTTILPEQLDFLYQKYQIESNPSRKMLEQIANEVGLRKRVVQVWFQNTRARERKGQFRAHQQVINKRCPFCPALFKVRSALESHLATKHADQYTRGEINIDALPDAEGGISGGEGIDSGEERQGNFIPGNTPPLLPISSNIEKSMRKYYEDTMKRYMDDLHANASNDSKEAGSQIKGNGMSTPTPPLPLGFPLLPRFPLNRDGQALDLTSPPPPHTFPAITDPTSGNKKVHTPGLDLTPSKSENEENFVQWDEKSIDGQDGSISESVQSTGEGYSPGGVVNSDNRSYDFVEGDERMSPIHVLEERGGLDSPGGGNYQLVNSHGDTSSLSSCGNKRFRTQMSNIQIKMMKSVFELYKTPTMNECASLGHEIGLQKRVVQVWFQNARAKEKKAKLALQQATGGPDLPGGSNGDLIVNPPLPEECSFCPGHKYVPNKQVLQDHIFTRSHLDNVKIAIEQGRHNPESPGHSLAQAAAALSSSLSTNSSHQASSLLASPNHLPGQYPSTQSSLTSSSIPIQPSSSSPSSIMQMRPTNTSSMSSNSAHLQMLQMAAAVTQCGGMFSSVPPVTMANITGGISTTSSKLASSENTASSASTPSSLAMGMDTLPISSATATTAPEEDKSIGEKNTSGHGETTEGTNRENMGKALMQLYGMGQGMNSFPTGVTQANPFLHPTMFSATGK